MITMQEWKAMGEKERTIWLEENTELNRRAKSLRGLVEGVGINDATYRTTPTFEGGKVKCPAYRVWAAMLKRAYSNKYHEKNTTYKCVNVCDEWHSFMSFREWWLDKQADGFSLDKDLLSDSRVYSPETCIFVPQWLNTFIIDRGASRGESPIGVDYHKGASRFRAQCGNPMSKKQEHLGFFTTPEEAHLAWRTRKLELALELKPKMDEIDIRIYPRIVEIINSAK